MKISIKNKNYDWEDQKLNFDDNFDNSLMTILTNLNFDKTRNNLYII